MVNLQILTMRDLIFYTCLQDSSNTTKENAWFKSMHTGILFLNLVNLLQINRLVSGKSGTHSTCFHMGGRLEVLLCMHIHWLLITEQLNSDEEKKLDWQRGDKRVEDQDFQTEGQFVSAILWFCCYGIVLIILAIKVLCTNKLMF